MHVTSGDRDFIPPGSTPDSPHNEKKAADFHVEGVSDTAVFMKLRRDAKSPIAFGFRLIQHGKFTVTSGPHLHLDKRNGPQRSEAPKKHSKFVLEGAVRTRRLRGRYIDFTVRHLFTGKF